MEQSNFQITSTDLGGNTIKIVCDGIDEQKLAHFGGLDLSVNAARTLIASTYSPMSFPEKDGDTNIGNKVVGILLNEIGALLRNTTCDDREEVSNLERVREFMEYVSENREVMQLLREDEMRMKKARENYEL